MSQFSTNLTALNINGQSKLLRVNNQNSTLITDCVTTLYGITTPTVVKIKPGSVITIATQTAGSSSGVLYNCNNVADASAANKIADIFNAFLGRTLQPFHWPCSIGITIIPGTGQVLAVSYI